MWLLCAWTDPILTALGVKEITPLKEFWVPAAIAVFLVQAWTASVYIRKPEHAAFAIYLLAAGMRDLAHYWAWWSGAWESIMALLAIAATIEATFHVTYCVRRYQQRYMRQGIMFCSIAGVAWAAWQIPKAFPEYDRDVYFTRLYASMFCLSMMVGALVCVWRNWNSQMLRLRIIQQAIVLVPWFGAMIWADRQTESVGDGWFDKTFIALAIQVFCLGLWIALARADVSVSAGRQGFGRESRK